MKTRSIFAAALAIVSTAATFGTAASAQNITVNADGHRVIAVPFEDLNLANEAGQGVLENRIASAAGKVCGDNAGRRSLSEAASIRRCMNAAKAQARSAIAAKTLHGKPEVIVVAKLDTARTR